MSADWTPTAEELKDVEAALAALEDVFAAAAQIALLQYEGSVLSRGNFRNGVHSLFDDVVPSERYMGVIFGLISEKHRAMLKRIALYRRPVICVGGDVTELKFITNEQFDLTSDLPLGPDDGTIILRLETRLDEHIRIPVTRTLVWERYQHANSLRVASDAILPSIASAFSRTGEAAIDLKRFCLEVDQHIAEAGISGLKVVVSNQLLATSCGPKEIVPRILSPPLVADVCVTGKATLEVTMLDGNRSFARVETPFMVRDHQLSIVGLSSAVLIPQFFGVQTATRWIMVNCTSSSASDRNMSYEASTIKESEKNSITQQALDEVLIDQIGFTRDELSFIFAEKELHQSSVSRMRNFLTAIIGESRTDQSTDALIVQSTRRLIPLNEDKRARYEQRVSNNGEIRDGPWDDTIDVAALNRAVYLMAELCGILPHIVARILELGIEATMGPVPSKLGYWEDAEWSKESSRVRKFVLCCYDLFSRRSNPWRWFSNTEADTHSDRLDSLVMANLHKADIRYPELDPDREANSRIESRPTASWDQADVLSIGRDMLNDLAISDHLSLRTFALSVNDWHGWKQPIMEESRSSLSSDTKREIDTTLRYAWKKHFADYAMPAPSGLVYKIESLVSTLVRDEARASGGYWTAETFLEIAIFFWLIKRYPSDNEAYVLSDWQLDVIHRSTIPFENRANLAAVIQHQDGNIRKVYDHLIQTIDNENLTVQSLCGDLVDPATLAELKALHNEP